VVQEDHFETILNIARFLRECCCAWLAVKMDTGAVLAVLPRYWVQHTRESRGDGNKACGTTAVMGLGLRELMHELWIVHLQISVD